MKTELKAFYEKKHLEHGHSSKGVGWDNEKVCSSRYTIAESMLEEEQMTVAEFGCGNAIDALSLFCYNKERKYIGIEPLRFYYEAALERIGGFKQATFVQHSIESFYEMYNKQKMFRDVYKYDYAISIGVFCLKLEQDKEEYYQEAIKAISQMLEMSKVGLIFNGFQDCVDRQDPEQFYFNMPRLLQDIYNLGYSKMELISRPDLNPYEFFIKIIK